MAIFPSSLQCQFICEVAVNSPLQKYSLASNSNSSCHGIDYWFDIVYSTYLYMRKEGLQQMAVDTLRIAMSFKVVDEIVTLFLRSNSCFRSKDWINSSETYSDSLWGHALNHDQLLLPQICHLQFISKAIGKDISRCSVAFLHRIWQEHGFSRKAVGNTVIPP